MSLILCVVMSQYPRLPSEAITIWASLPMISGQPSTASLISRVVLLAIILVVSHLPSRLFSPLTSSQGVSRVLLRGMGEKRITR